MGAENNKLTQKPTGEGVLKVKVLKVPESLSSHLSSRHAPQGVNPLKRAINKTFSYKAKHSQDMDIETI